MHFVNTTINLQQVNITSNSIEHGSFSALSHQLLLDIRTRYIFEITCLNHFIDIVETETQAIEALYSS